MMIGFTRLNKDQKHTWLCHSKMNVQMYQLKSFVSPSASICFTHFLAFHRFNDFSNSAVDLEMTSITSENGVINRNHLSHSPI
jgi:hypothetical protein